MRASDKSRKTLRHQEDAAPDSAEVEEKRPGTVQSVEVALQVLEGIADNNGLVRVNELARQLGMTKARVSRHMQTLLGLGLVARGPQEGYTFGWKLLRLGRAALQDRTLVELSRPHMLALRDEVGQTVILSMPAPGGAVVVSCVESLDLMPVTLRIAGFLAAPGSPAGRLSEGLKHGATPADAALLKHWPAFRAEYELDSGRGIGGVAVPLLDEQGSIVAALSVVAPSPALRPRPPRKMVDAMWRCVEAIQAEYGR